MDTFVYLADISNTYMYLEIEVPQNTFTPDWALLIEIVYKQSVGHLKLWFWLL